MTEPVALPGVVGDLAHELGPHRHPVPCIGGRSATGGTGQVAEPATAGEEPVLPGVAGQARQVRQELVDQRGPADLGEGRDHADELQLPVCVVQAQEE